MSENETQASLSRTVPSHTPTYQKSATSVWNIAHITYMIHRLSQLLRTSIKYLIEEWYLVVKPEENSHLESLSVDGRIPIKSILKT